MEDITWERLIELEPRLLSLYKRALAIRNSGERYDPLEVWYRWGGMRDWLVGLVGWSRKDNPELATCAAYDIAYDKIFFEALCGGEY